MKRLLITALLLYAAYNGWTSWQNRAVAVRIDDALAPDAPQQENLPARNAPSFQIKNYQLTAQARYRTEARLLRKEPYRTGREADLSPVDFALGWGPMSANSLLVQLTITQSGSFYWLRWQDLSVPQSVVMHNSANTHIIPATKDIAKQVERMRPGQVVELEGYLVNATAPDGWRWNTSLSRTDTGNGACELLWVEQARIVR